MTGSSGLFKIGPYWSRRFTAIFILWLKRRKLQVWNKYLSSSISGSRTWSASNMSCVRLRDRKTNVWTEWRWTGWKHYKISGLPQPFCVLRKLAAQTHQQQLGDLDTPKRALISHWSKQVHLVNIRGSFAKLSSVQIMVLTFKFVA